MRARVSYAKILLLDVYHCLKCSFLGEISCFSVKISIFSRCKTFLVVLYFP